MKKVILPIVFFLITLKAIAQQDYKVHTVSPGNTLYNISSNYGVTVEELKTWNNLTSNSISVGQKLKIYNTAKQNTSNISSNESANRIIVTKKPQKVPEGKVWKLERGTLTVVQVGYGVLNSGSFCNGMFLSRPGILANINKGNYYRPESFCIIFQSFEKVPYTNEYTYSVMPISIVDRQFSLSDLASNKPEEVGEKEIKFMAGEEVFVGNCLESIELTEYRMNKEELAAYNASKSKPTDTFSLPVNPEKYVEPGTIPEWHDKQITKIVFSSGSVVHKSPEKRGLDDVTNWTMTLTAKEFELESSTGLNRSYTVKTIKYDELLKAQGFELTENSENSMYNLSISWSNSSSCYYVILQSADKTVQYQFQQVQATLKE